MKRSETILNLASALSKAQGQFDNAIRDHVARVISKKGEGSSYQYNYADLASVLEAVRDPMAKNGLSIVQLPFVEGGNVSVITTLFHDTGEFIESEPLVMPLSSDLAGPQAIGSAITYARRYSLSAILGIATETDDDANSASGHSAQTSRRDPPPNAPKCPLCSKPMKERTGKKGPFWGCVGFPECKGIVDFAAVGHDSTPSKQPASAKLDDHPQFKRLSNLCVEIGSKNEAETDKILEFLKPGASRGKCWTDEKLCEAVIEALRVAVDENHATYSSIYADATGTAAVVY